MHYLPKTKQNPEYALKIEPNEGNHLLNAIVRAIAYFKQDRLKFRKIDVINIFLNLAGTYFILSYLYL